MDESRVVPSSMTEHLTKRETLGKLSQSDKIEGISRQIPTDKEEGKSKDILTESDKFDGKKEWGGKTAR